MEDILERTHLVGPHTDPYSMNFHQQRNKIASHSSNVNGTTNQLSNPYENLQPPPKPSFNHAAILQLFASEAQFSAPPKPTLDAPQSEELDSLIYTTIKECRPNASETKSEELTGSISSSPSSKRFTVTPVSSGDSPTPTPLRGSISSQGSNIDVPSKLATSQEPVKFITVPEDLANLNRRSIMRARLRKSIEYAKRALGFIISHIGLSLLVVGYTILGALVFCAVERERERQVKTQMLVRFNNTLTELMDLWIASYLNLRTKFDLAYKIATRNQTLEINTQAKHGLEGLDWYLQGLELSKEVIPKHWLEGIMSENSSSTFGNFVNSTTKSQMQTNLYTTAGPGSASTIPSLKNGTSQTGNLDFDYKGIMEMLFNNTTNTAQISNVTLLAESIRANITRIIAGYVNHVVHAIKDEGWNGASNFDDINWTFEGGVLFAITVITTIGKQIRDFDL